MAEEKNKTFKHDIINQDITLMALSPEEIEQAKEMQLKNYNKWKDDNSNLGKMQKNRSIISFLNLIRGHKKNSKRTKKNLSDYQEEIQKNNNVLLIELFSRYDYKIEELQYIESRLIALYKDQRFNFDDPFVQFSLRELLDTEISIRRLRKRITQGKSDISIMRTENSLSKELARYRDLKQDLSIIKPKLTKKEEKEKEKEEEGKEEQKKVSSMIAKAMKEEEEGREKTERKIKDMLERRRLRMEEGS